MAAKPRAHGDDDTSWYWDLHKQVAVPASQRGAADHMLGPYDSRAEAENWKATAEDRNVAWQADDDEWNQRDAPSSGGRQD